MKEYLSGTMLPEEAHAAEVHLSSCPLCSLAMEGFEEHSEQALQAIAALNSGFLKEHFDNISPQIHLNSMAPAATMPLVGSDRKRRTLQPYWRMGSVAAALLLLFGLVWALGHRNKEAAPPSITFMSEANGGQRGEGNAINRGNNNDLRNNGVAAPVMTQAQNVTQTDHSKNKTTIASTSKESNSLAKTLNDGTARKKSSPANTGDQVDVNLKMAPHTSSYVDFETLKANEEAKKETTTASTTSESLAKSSISPTAPRSKPPMAAEVDSDRKTEAELGDESYGKGSYGAALAQYKKGMNSDDARTRYHSMVMAAQCYAALGNKAKAEQILQEVIDKGPGAERRQARKALRKLK
jgi:FimV-like protein